MRKRFIKSNLAVLFLGVAIVALGKTKGPSRNC